MFAGWSIKIPANSKVCFQVSRPDQFTFAASGAGFVEFYDVNAVDKVIKLNGEKLLGRAVRIDYG